MDLSQDAVLALAPDEASIKAARGLMAPAKWPLLGVDEHAIWGECQGSGSKPYQVQVDLNGPAFKCSCPSRKFPCKHGLALLLLVGQQPRSNSTPPVWVTEWLDSRRQRAEKVVTSPQTPSSPDPTAQAKREAQREQRMQAGLQELQTWLCDQLRQGVAPLIGKTAPFLTLAQRMVDAQLPGVALRLRRLAEQQEQGAEAAQLLTEFGQLQLLLDGFQRLEQLPETVQQDIRATLGQGADREAVLAAADLCADDWLVLAVEHSEEDRLTARRVWLQGRQHQRMALLLDYAHSQRPFEQSYMAGACFQATLAFYPGNAYHRALLATGVQPPQVMFSQPQGSSLTEASWQHAQTLAQHPWHDQLPVICSGVVICWHQQHWWALAHDHQLPLLLTEQQGWQLLAASGGQAVTLFAQWQPSGWRALSAWQPALCWHQGG